MALAAADSGQAIIHVPAIVMAELYFANVKTGYPIDFEETFQTLERSDQFVFTPFEASDVLDFGRDASASEMHDRMTVGVARRLGAPLLTADRNITASG